MSATSLYTTTTTATTKIVGRLNNNEKILTFNSEEFLDSEKLFKILLLRRVQIIT